jgi:hypothetical protein
MKFKDLNKIRIEKENIIGENDKYDEVNYFKVIANNYEWPLYYAMDHISQISFFQHYIFHNILYVTGATGQGKSTQVPKLLLYALKMLDYKNDGKIICTQPRISPTINNASRISEELGLPLDQIDNNHKNKIKTNNYYVQYQYMKDKHTKSNLNHNSLNIVTDGILYEMIKSNPYMKDGNNQKNIIDIIIIDEAHEHNPNMDLIITIARQTCYNNKNIKLIIMSATMDDDEPIYRRYFKNIIEKENYFFNPFTNKIESLKPEYMDRRYHISPPGQTTQYTINEYYEDDEPNFDNKKNSQIIQEKGYNKIIELCKKNIDGEILFFANGQNEISQAVKYLNENLPIGNVALPYFSIMNNIYKNIIENIDKKIYSIKNKRENIYLEWGEKYIEDKTIPTGLYKRAIIIATNVAEASITIPRLKFVVDNGYNKVNSYNMSNNKTILIEEKISESSRLQRKGRVGRISDGSIYYLYPKNAREKIITNYKITQENISDKLIDLLHNKDIDYNKTDNINMIFEIYNDNKIKGQYIENLIDQKGKFYLIHPFENRIRRNILNNIFQFDNIFIDNIKLSNYKYIFTNLLNRNLLVDNSNTLYHYNYEHNDINRKFIKSELCDIVLKVAKKFTTTEKSNINNTITLISAYNMNCYNIVFELITLIEIIGNTIETITNIPFDKYKEIHSNVNSDIIFLYNILIKFKKQFNLKLFNLNKEKIDLIIRDQNDNYKKFIELIQKNKNPSSVFDDLIFNEYISLYNNNVYSLDNISLSNKLDDIYMDINYNKNNIIKWCDSQYIDSNIILKFLNTLTSKYSDIDLLNPDNLFKDLNNPNFNKQLTSNTIEEKILRSFIYGYPDQIGIKTTNTLSTYMNYNMFRIKESLTKDIRLKTTSSLTPFSNIIFYLFYETSKLEEISEVKSGKENIQVSYINHIDPRWIIPANPFIFNPKYYSDISRYIIYNDRALYINNSDYYKYLVRIICNNWNENSTIWNVKNMPILQKYLQKVNNIISLYR